MWVLIHVYSDANLSYLMIDHQPLLMIDSCILIPSMVWLVTIFPSPIYPIPPWLIGWTKHIFSVRLYPRLYSNMYVNYYPIAGSKSMINWSSIKIYHHQDDEPHPHLSLCPLHLNLHYPSPDLRSSLLGAVDHRIDHKWMLVISILHWCIWS